MVGYLLIKALQRYEKKKAQGRPEEFVKSYDAVYAQGTVVLTGKRKRV